MSIRTKAKISPHQLLRILSLVFLVGGALTALSGPIHEACSKGDLETVMKLVQSNPSSVNEAESALGMTPLMFAVRTNQAVVEFLVRNRAELNRTNATGATALHLAVLAGNRASVEHLLEHGADVNAADARGFNAVHFALCRWTPKHKEVLEVLAKYRVDFNLRTKQGRTPLDMAKVLGYPVPQILQRLGAQ